MFGTKLIFARAPEGALRRAALQCTCIALSICVAACGDKAVSDVDASATKGSASKPLAPAEGSPPASLQPAEVWSEGKRAGPLDARAHGAVELVSLDLGEAWTPNLFSDGSAPDGQAEPHRFRATYLALARGEFPKNPYGERAQDDKYLELYGIMPTLGALRARLKWARELPCFGELDLSALVSFGGVVTYQGPAESVRTHRRYLRAARDVARFMAVQKVDDPSLIALEKIKKKKDQASVKFYLQEHDDTQAIEAAQARLACEGYFKNKGKWLKGAFDWPTHEALAEFERRHRIYSWGALGSKTVEALRQDSAELEHQAVIRVLVERAMHALGAIEDGSAKKSDGSPYTFKGADGQIHEVPNLEAALRAAVVRAFGLSSPEATYAFLESLGELPKDGHRHVAIPGPKRPEYHSPDMELSVVIDRGDVWYEFPFDESGKERPQPVTRRPYTSLFVSYLGQRFPIARFGTTIGGWKSELIENVVWWKYKESPPGPVLWKEIVSAPVWLPPNSTPPRDLLKRRKKRKQNEPKWEVNYHETGPSYASAYGLVAAYHRRYKKEADGTVQIGGDEGIRSHGSVDYMSIMRRHSHGCHRLHNHIAVRLFSFVLQHRPYTRGGHQPTAFVMDVEYEQEKHHIEIRQGGYAFRLDRPIFVNVEQGRIKGKVNRPVYTAIPKYNAQCKAYILPDGGTVVPLPHGKLVPASPPPVPCDAGVPAAPPSLAAADSPTAALVGEALPSWAQPDLVTTQPSRSRALDEKSFGRAAR